MVIRKEMNALGPIYTVRFLSHATSSRQAYDMTYDCRNVLKKVLKCYDIFLTYSASVNQKMSWACRKPLSHGTKIVPCKSALKEARN